MTTQKPRSTEGKASQVVDAHVHLGQSIYGECLDLDTLLPPIESRLRAAMIEAVGDDAADRFAAGLPAWDHTPGYLNIPAMLWLRSIALAYDLHEYAKKRYNMLGRGGHWLPGRNAAHIDDFDLEKRLASSPFRDKIPDWLRQTHEMLYQAPEKRLSQT